jgi:hypothetical protein
MSCGLCVAVKTCREEIGVDAGAMRADLSLLYHMGDECQRSRFWKLLAGD